MTLQQLEYIVALDNYRHFVTAAEKCYVSQPNLSMQVKKLEDEIGVRIFDRDQKPLAPTRTGEQILLKARQILREVGHLKAYVSNEKESTKGEYTLGIIPTLAPYLLPLFLPEFLKSHPDTRLIIRELQTEEIIRNLQQGTLDIGLAVTPLEEKSIREVALFHEPFLLYLPEGHHLLASDRLDPDELDREELLLLGEGHCFREQALSLCNGRSPDSESGFAYESGSVEALMGLVRHGLGYTLVPEMSVGENADPKHVRRFQAPEPVREVSIVAHQSFSREALLEELRDAIQAAVPDSFRKMSHFMRVKWR
jgi:LysR family hydrogen peroxide-inducible transcriptional activator